MDMLSCGLSLFKTIRFANCDTVSDASLFGGFLWVFRPFIATVLERLVVRSANYV